MLNFFVFLTLSISINAYAGKNTILKNKDGDELITNVPNDPQLIEYDKEVKQNWNPKDNKRGNKVYDKELYKFVEVIGLCVQNKKYGSDGLKETCLRVADGALGASSAIFNLVESFKLDKEDLTGAEHPWVRLNNAAVNLKMAIEKDDYSFESYMGWSCFNILLIYKSDPDLFKSKPICYRSYLYR